jgi:hypothetical protein
MWRSLVDLVRDVFRFKNRGRLNHPEHLEKGGGFVGWAAKAPGTILADTAIVDVPIAAAISERAGYEHAFNEPVVVYHNGLVVKV